MPVDIRGYGLLADIYNAEEIWRIERQIAGSVDHISFYSLNEDEAEVIMVIYKEGKRNE